MYSDQLFKEIFARTKVIAVVGLSHKTERPSHSVAAFLQDKGYRVVPVNPGKAGEQILGETVFASLADVPFDVDMVDIFRRSEAAPGIVEEALARWPNLQTIWMQIGVQHANAAAQARGRGVDVVENRCPKIEYQRLFEPRV